MRRFIFGLIILAVAVWIGVKIAADPGYVLLAYQQTTVETPLWFALLGLVLLFALLYLFLRLIKNVRRLPNKLRGWMARRRVRINQRLTHQGLLALAIGSWPEAEKKLIKATPKNALAWLNYIAAARAAYERGEKEKREQYLQQAMQANPAAEIAVGIEQFYFEYEQQQFEQALAILQRVYQLAPRQNYVLRLLLRLCVRLEEWQTVLNLLPKARKQKVLAENKLLAIEVQAQAAILHKYFHEDAALQVIERHWENLRSELQHDPKLLNIYANLLVKKGEMAKAEKLIRQHLNKQWHEQLVRTYGLVACKKPDDQLNYAEKWLQAHAHDAILLLTLGRICMRHQLWGKARSYLEASITFAPRAETYYELARLFEKLAEPQLAYNAYQTGLSLVAQHA